MRMSRAESLKKYWALIKSDPEAYSKRGKRKAKRSVQERFWEKVDKFSNVNGCWLWTGAVLSIKNFPYGIFQYKGKATRAHRMAYILTNGPIKSHDCVLHRCDNPRCVNPDHLFLGNKTINIIDRDNKGRQMRGEKHVLSKITKDDVIKIRNLYKTKNYSQAKLGAMFNLRQCTVSAIICKKTWKHINETC